MVKKFGKKWTLVGSDYLSPHAYLDIGKKLLADNGATVLTEEYAPLGTTDWSSVVAKLKGANPEVILSAVVGGDAIAFIKAAGSLDLLSKSHITGVILPDYYPALGNAIDGQYVVARYSEEIPTEANKSFVSAYKQKYGEGPCPR